jgi:NADPH-ferrihemoprotein reductase
MSNQKKTMDNTLYVAGGITLLAGIVGYFVYKSNMGASCSSNSVQPSANSDDKTKGGKKEKGKGDANKYPCGKINIYFGSQTGTAEGFARTLMEEGKEAGFDAKSCDLEEFTPEALSQCKLAIFLMATYGEGEPTDNASKFYKWLKNDDESTDAAFLSSLSFTVFGLGNRQYEHYNRMGKAVNEYLEKVGGKRIFAYGEGDDDGTLEEDFDKWRATLWSSLKEALHLAPASSADGHASTNATNEHELSIHPVSLSFTTKSYGSVMPSDTERRGRSNTLRIQNSTKHFFNSKFIPLAVKKELRNQSFVSPNGEEVGSTLHLEFDLKGSGITYHTADNLVILPENSTESVLRLASLLRYDLNEVVDLVPTEDSDEDDFKLMYPTPCTIRDLLTRYVDIQGKLHQSTMKHLVAYVSDPTQRAWVLELAKPENRSKFHAEIEETHLSLVDLLIHYLPSVSLPLADFLHITSPIQARDYTISSSSSLYPTQVHITVSITEYAANKNRFVGLASGYFKSLQEGVSKCRLYVKESTFRLPMKTLDTSPIIMIGPGTGLAPMRALLQERQYLLSKGQPLAPALLFFGCKHEKMDFIYSSELADHHSSHRSLSSLHTAFSRDTAKKVYVQHLLAEKDNVELLMRYILEENAYIYVCGATAMGTDVLHTIVKLVSEAKAVSIDEATLIVKKLQEKKPNQPARYIQELWS